MSIAKLLKIRLLIMIERLEQDSPSREALSHMWLFERFEVAL